MPHDPHKDGKFRIRAKRRQIVEQEFQFPEAQQFTQDQQTVLFRRLHAMAKKHLTLLAQEGRGVKDFKEYLMEEVMIFMFGREIFKTIEDIQAGGWPE